MIPRLLILIGLVLAGFSALFYLVTRVHRFRFSLALARGRHGWSWVISVLAVLLPSAAIWLAWGYMNAIICLLHLALFWLLSDALFALLKRLHGKPWRRYYAGLTALLLTAAYLSAVGCRRTMSGRQTTSFIRTSPSTRSASRSSPIPTWAPRSTQTALPASWTASRRRSPTCS